MCTRPERFAIDEDQCDLTADEEEERCTVVKLQVGVFGDIAKWQRDLERLSSLYDTDEEGGLHAIFQETLQLVLRNMEYVSYATSGGRVFNDIDQAESKFNEVSFEERSKFKEETLTNVDGRMARSRGRSFAGRCCPRPTPPHPTPPHPTPPHPTPPHPTPPHPTPPHPTPPHPTPPHPTPPHPTPPHPTPPHPTPPHPTPPHPTPPHPTPPHPTPPHPTPPHPTPPHPTPPRCPSPAPLPARMPGDLKDMDQWLCLTLVIAMEREMKLPKISTMFDLRQASERLGMGAWVHGWLRVCGQTEDDGDAYSKDELLADYPTLAMLGVSKARAISALKFAQPAKAKPAQQPGRWMDRDCNAALNMQRIGERRWRPLELCWWPKRTALPAKGKEYPDLGYKRLRGRLPKAQQQQPAVRPQPAKHIRPLKSKAEGKAGNDKPHSQLPGPNIPPLSDRTLRSMAKAEAPTNGDLHKSLMNGEKANEAVEKAEEKPEDVDVPYFQLYNSAERFDYLLMAIGTVGACGNGIAWPLFAVIFKDFTDTFGNPGADFMSDIRQIALSFVWLALGAMVGSYLQASMWMWAGNRQTSRLRQQYLQAVLRQNVSTQSAFNQLKSLPRRNTSKQLRHVAYFDTQATTGTLLQGLNSDSAAVEAAISEKTGHFIQHSTTFIAGIIVAFVGGWDMTLVMVGTMPFLAAAGAVLAKVTAVMSSRTSKAYTDASSLAQQALSQVRTVAAYNGEERTVSSYEKALEMPTNVGIQQSMYTGMALGSVNAVVYFTYSLAFYYGAWRVYTGNYTGGQVLQVFVAALLGGFSIGQASSAAPVLEVFAKGRVAGGKLYAVINRIPEIDPDNTSGRILDKVTPDGGDQGHVEGTIELRNVSFAYPARPDAQIFRNFCLTVPAGKTVALVGSSGSGKSTVVQLVERFYDPLGGAVLLDGVDLRSLQVKWLRTQVGLVSQEPTLFATTIFANIAMGKEGATEAEVQAAAEAANAHTFISHQPKGYQTQVGERGLQMSGGQKQRIAIARAILKNPRIMLLDEATSALDTQSERLVQDALNRMIVGRTTVVVAHRLSTIKDADIIAVVQAGAVVEQGSHQELIANPEGLYGALVKLQMREEAEKAQSMQAGALPEVEEEDGYAEEGGDEEQGKASYTGGTVELGLVGVRNPVNGTSAVEPMVPVPMASELAHAALSAGSGHVNGHTNGHDNALHRASNSHQRPSIGKRPSMEKRLSMDKSSSMQAKDGKEEASAIIPAEPESDVSFMRIAHLNRPEWRYGLVGLLASAVCGAIQPAFAFIMASFVTVFYTGQDNIMKEASFYSWMFFVVGCSTLVATILQQWSFGVMGLQLARRLRVAMMRAMVHNEVGWFDREENSSGVLTTKLGSDASYVRGAVGDTLGLMLQNVLCLAFGYVIALVYDWRMALVVTGALPFMIIGSIIYYRTITGNDSGSSMKFAKANQAVSDAFSSVRVVQAYNLQGQILALYTDLVAGVTSSMRMQSHYTGALMGYSQFSIFAVYGLIIYFGGVEVSSGRVDFEGMLKSFLAILLAAMGIAQAQIGFPDIGKAKDAVKSIFPIIDRKSQIDSSSQEGVTSPPRGGLHLEGQIQLQDVTFRYPARPTVTVFKGFTLDIPAGQTVALVGESGSGKSTIVGLVLRYYDVVMGQLLVDGLDVRSYNLRWLRSHIGLVSQEPLLFSCSVGDNIRYGLPGASQEEVEAAARAANAHDFISALPEGYNTHVGERGVQLSGGQKQRVAIARAVVKNPRIMLLDEATSALDAHAEKVVQDALDHIMVGRTSVVVAHRLSTIRNADKIALVYRGTILEQGTHAELMALPDGGYARLVAAQNGQRAPTNQGTLPVSKSELAFANAADGQP
ncbi:hypothetical protein QJQ45_020777 [Haematococcus lacustris]|nr:hypothetical protein QJQ45_020777 [Haematococcus lacustris]